MAALPSNIARLRISPAAKAKAPYHHFSFSHKYHSVVLTGVPSLNDGQYKYGRAWIVVVPVSIKQRSKICDKALCWKKHRLEPQTNFTSCLSVKWESLGIIFWSYPAAISIFLWGDGPGVSFDSFVMGKEVISIKNYIWPSIIITGSLVLETKNLLESLPKV